MNAARLATGARCGPVWGPIGVLISRLAAAWRVLRHGPPAPVQLPAADRVLIDRCTVEDLLDQAGALVDLEPGWSRLLTSEELGTLENVAVIAARVRAGDWRLVESGAWPC